ncbi:hypothetical protein V5O48_018464, partial [Marasmius crinis-equi]
CLEYLDTFAFLPRRHARTMESFSPTLEGVEWEEVIAIPRSPSESCFSSPPGTSYTGSPFRYGTEKDGIQNGEEMTTSTAFYPGAATYYLPSDVAFVSLDMVCFHVHSELLLNISQNCFNSLIPVDHPLNIRPTCSMTVPEQSSILNIILHIAYGISVTPFAPTLEMLSSAMERLRLYGIEPKTAIPSCSAFQSTLMLHAPVHPLELYTLASKYDLFGLARATSPYLLSLPLENITNAVAESIGPLYLLRLFSLQRNLLAALKHVLARKPLLHPSTPSCDALGQESVAKAWTLASAYLIWQARPDMPPDRLESILRSLPLHASCHLCKERLNERIDTVVHDWQALRRTI